MFGRVWLGLFEPVLSIALLEVVVVVHGSNHWRRHNIPIFPVYEFACAYGGKRLE